MRKQFSSSANKTVDEKELRRECARAGELEGRVRKLEEVVDRVQRMHRQMLI